MIDGEPGKSACKRLKTFDWPIRLYSDIVRKISERSSIPERLWGRLLADSGRIMVLSVSTFDKMTGIFVFRGPGALLAVTSPNIPSLDTTPFTVSIFFGISSFAKDVINSHLKGLRSYMKYIANEARAWY